MDKATRTRRSARDLGHTVVQRERGAGCPKRQLLNIGGPPFAPADIRLMNLSRSGF
jgi:hypothetical protein